MTNFSYENQGTNTYLVYQIGQNDNIDSMSLGMITNNQIAGLAPAVFMQMDAVKYIKYNVSAKISVKQFFNGPVNKRRLLGVFNGIAAAMLSAEDYMIDERMILLDADYMFADVSTCETVLVCLPIQNKGETTDLGAFFKNIMFSTQFDQTENCDYVARIINHLNSTPVFSLSQFKAVLDDINGKSFAPAVQSSAKKEQPVIDNRLPLKSSVTPPQVQANAAPVLPQKPAPQPVVPQKAPISVQVPSVEKNHPNVPSATKQPNPQQAEKNENEISLFYLLQHYNSENAAAYKAQKAAKKQGTAVSVSQTVAPPEKKEKSSDKKKVQTQPTGAGFAIPGQASAVSTQVQPQMPVQPIRSVQPQAVTPIPEPSQPPVQPAVPPRPLQSASGINFGETTVLGGGVAGETSVLNVSATAAKQLAPHLVRAKNNEVIPVNKPVFRIGKEKSYVDYFVADNTAVSRSHANIITREDKYFVVDTNSTNHTFVNGKMIPSSTEVEILHGTKLRFANEDFEFQLY